jgi:outer membrane biosynthesis protein TonB
MAHMFPRSRFLSIATSPARLGHLVLTAAFAAVLVPSALAGVIAQQTPAPAPDPQPAAQTPAAAESSQPTPAPPPDSQPASPAPSAQQPSADQPSQAAPAPPAENPPSPATAPAASQPAPAASQNAPPSASEPAEITEDEIKTLLVGKELFLRGGYLDNDLSYNENGVLVGHSSQGSYTLSAIQIDKIHLTKHKLELEGQRFGLHFLGALPYEDPTKAVDRVNITPKKKIVKIAIDRELVVKPKEKKEKEKGKEAKPAPNPASAAAPATAAAPAPPVESTGAPATTEAAQAETAAAPPAERPADAKSVTTTTSQAHSNKLLRDALDNVFAQGFDARMMDAMPDFWKLYYAAAAAKTDYQPADPGVLRQSMVDKKARLASTFEPPSNEYAQDHGVAGICLYHVVIGADGKPGEISVGRPIGFGLDENAVDAIRKATFEPATKDGKPVPVLLNLVVEFRIYSNRTAVTANPTQQPPESSLPGPYSVQH